MNPKLIFAAAKKNLPSILSWTAVGGVALTGWLTHKAARKSDPEEPFKKHWKNYIPCGIAGIGTIACIIGSNCAHLKVEAGLAGAVAFYKALYEDADEAFKDVKALNVNADEGEKIQDGYPVMKKSEAEKSLKQDDISIEVYEPYTKQRFKTNQKEILWAELEANKLMSSKGTVTLNEVLALYKNAKHKPYGDRIGWSWDEDWFNECASYYWHGGWIDICPQYIDKNGKREFIMDYGIQPMDISETIKRPTRYTMDLEWESEKK